MDNEQHNNGAVPAPGQEPAIPAWKAAAERINAQFESKPDAPADPVELAFQTERLHEMSNLLAPLADHVRKEYNNVLDGSDDNTPPAYASDEAEGVGHIDQAYAAQHQAEQILRKDNLTNQDVETLEGVLDEMDSSINEATPLTFNPDAVPAPL